MWQQVCKVIYLLLMNVLFFQAPVLLYFLLMTVVAKVRLCRFFMLIQTQ